MEQVLNYCENNNWYNHFEIPVVKMGKLLINIKSCYSSMSKTEKRIADYIIENINSVSPMTITDLSAVSGASEATIVRFAKRIGCNEAQITRWTRGFPNYTLSSMAKLSEALGEPLIQVPDSETTDL